MTETTRFTVTVAINIDTVEPDAGIDDVVEFIKNNIGLEMMKTADESVVRIVGITYYYGDGKVVSDD